MRLGWKHKLHLTDKTEIANKLLQHRIINDNNCWLWTRTIHKRAMEC